MTDFYPGAIMMLADRSNYRPALRATFRLIVIHVTDGHGKAQPVGEMWRKPGHGSSAHFVIDQDGTVLQCVQLRDVAWHAHIANDYSIGIEHCARTPGELSESDPGLPLSTEQYAASAKLVAWLCRVAGREPSRDVIQGHAEADPMTTHLDCPTGAGWDWDRFMAMVETEYAA